MKKSIIAITIAALLSGVSAPAFAGDGARLGIGIGMAILGKVIEGANKGGSRSSGKRSNGDTLIGRVFGDDEDKGSSRGNGSRNRKIAGGAAAGAAVAAVSIPEIVPVPEARPSDEEVAALLSRPLPSNSDDDGQSVAMLDENGISWGEVSPEVADKVDKAVGLGMLRSQAIAALTGLKEPKPTAEQADAMTTAAVEDAANTPPAGQQPVEGVEVAQVAGGFAPPVTDTFADGSDGSELLKDEAPAEPVKKAANDYGTMWNKAHTKGTVVDETGAAWGDLDAATIAKVDAATDGGMKRSEAIAANSEWASPGRTKAQVAAEAARRAESERKWAEAQRQAEEAAKAERERVAAQQAAREKARAEEIAAAEAKRKADAQRAAAEAALPEMLRGGSQPESVAVSPSTTPKADATAQTLPAVDKQATTASTKADDKAVVDVAPAEAKPAPKKSGGMKIDL